MVETYNNLMNIGINLKWLEKNAKKDYDVN